jgi:hypothetical protein
LVTTTSRLDTAHKVVNNIYLATLVTRDLSNFIAQEIESYAELLKENGDIYSHFAGLIKAAQLIREGISEREL